MKTPTEERRIDHAPAVDAIAAAAFKGELDLDKLEKILAGHYGGGVNCYPGTPTNTCHSVVYFVALEGRLGKRLKRDFYKDPFLDVERDDEASKVEDLWGTDTRYEFGEILERFVLHMQGHCAGVARQAVIVTDTWYAGPYEHWRTNIVEICKTAAVEIHLIGEGGLKQRILCACEGVSGRRRAQPRS